MSKAVFKMVFCFHPACKLSIEEYANLKRKNKVVVTGDPTRSRWYESSNRFRKNEKKLDCPRSVLRIKKKTDSKSRIKKGDTRLNPVSNF